MRAIRLRYASVRGRITSEWHHDGDTFRLGVEIPPNVTATVVPPGGETRDIGPGRHSFDAAWASDRQLVRARPRAEL
jgi:hypothetical protein